MDDSFRVRVDKIFGTLAPSSSAVSSSSSLSSLWCLTDDEIERREWNRDKDSPEPKPVSDFQGSFVNDGRRSDNFSSELEKDLSELDDDLEDEARVPKPEDYNDEEWEIKSSIGLDCTLDYEEEEDAFDSVAIGKENTGDRLYMKDVNDYGIDVDSCNELPDSFKDFSRDPRANHLAAKIRLKEDAEAAKKIDSLRVSEKDTPTEIKTSEVIKVKSILKRKDNPTDPRSEKRVRFDSECKQDDNEEAEIKFKQMETCLEEEPVDTSLQIPDYLRNPSKYTHYTFDDSSDIDQESNLQAYMDFLKMVNKSDTSESEPGHDAPSDHPESVTFISKRKMGDAKMVENCMKGAGKECLNLKGLPVGIAARDSEENDEVCAMEEEEEPETATETRNNTPRSSRQYRVKAMLETEDAMV